MVLAAMTLLLVIPILGALAMLLTPKRLAWYAAILISAATLLQAIALNFPATIRHNWIPAIGAQFLLTVDGINGGVNVWGCFNLPPIPASEFDLASAEWTNFIPPDSSYDCSLELDRLLGTEG